MKATGSLRVKRGIWQIVIDYHDETGQRRQISQSTGLAEKGNKRRAQQVLDQRLEELSHQYTAALEAKNVLFLDFMRNWLDEVMVYKIRENTLSQYKMTFNGYIAKYKPFHGVKLQNVTPVLIQSYYNEQMKAGLSSNTIRKHHANLHKCLDYAVRLGLITNNPTEQTELPPKQRYTGAAAYTPQQMKELLQLFDGDPLEAPVRIAAAYGLRRSEVCGLRWKAIDFEEGTISICHTAVVDNGKVIYSDNTKAATSNRLLPLTEYMRGYLLEIKKRQEECREALRSAYTDSGYVCTKNDGTPINPDFVTHHFQRKLKAAKLPVIRFHDLRHSAVYALRKGGCDVKDIQAWLGHSDVSTTLNVYGHVMGGDMKRLERVMDSAMFQPSRVG